MTGDYTRNTFRPERQFSSVRLQQGRVQLDADWNEAADIALDADRQALADVIGPAGVPADAPGFAIEPLAGGEDFAIGFGRAYVEGLEVENAAAPLARLTRVEGAGAAAVWQVDEGPRLSAGQWLAAPDDPATRRRVEEVVEEAPLRVRLSDDVPGDGFEAVVQPTYLTQPHLPDPPDLPDGTWLLAYLDVWEREITALDDPAIRDEALGGPDTALRRQKIWQVRFAALDPLIDAEAMPAPPLCGALPADWHPRRTAPRTRLAARVVPAGLADDPCLMPAAGGYRSLDNRLYRVEVHRGGEAGADPGIAVKWSRDNAIRRSRLLDVADGSLVVDSVGPDAVVAFADGDWLEVLDEARALAGEPGFFVEIDAPVGTRLGIRQILHPETLAPLEAGGEPDTAVLPRHGTVRRWEGGVPVPVAPGDWLALEDGVEIRFDPGHAATGDFWTIPARSLTARLDWPDDPATGDPAARPAEGVPHHLMPLAIMERIDGGWDGLDCRRVFPPLTELESFFYLGGDGQEAMPDLVGGTTHTALAAPFRVGVARGRTPVAGRLVRFRVLDNQRRGRLAPGPDMDPADVVTLAADGREMILRTGPSGEASAAFSLDRRRQTHRVVAELLDAGRPDGAEPDHLPIVFTSSLSTAATTAFDPSNCRYQSAPEIADPPAGTVQQAIDRLCPRLELTIVGGDGQQVCVGEEGRAPLAVGVFWGGRPLRDVEIAFEVAMGDVKVEPDRAKTDEQGVARATLVGGDDALRDEGFVLVKAMPVDPPAAPVPDALLFHARYINAACVYLDPEVCPEGQEEARDNTLAGLLGVLCRREGGGAVKPPALHVTGIFAAIGRDPDTPLTTPLGAGARLRPEELARGIRFALDGPVDRQLLKRMNEDVGQVVLDLPWPVASQERFVWWTTDDIPPSGHFARRPTYLNGRFRAQDGDGDRQVDALIWSPDQTTGQWLRAHLEKAMRQMEILQPIPGRMVLFGGQIMSETAPRRHLDGTLFFDDSRLGLRLPSGDGTPGGDLLLPFRLVLGDGR